MPDWRPVRSLITRTRLGRGLLSIAFYPFPAAQNPGPRGLDSGHFGLPKDLLQVCGRLGLR